MPTMPTIPARPAPIAVGRAAPPVEEAVALLPLRLAVDSEEPVVLLSSEEEVELADEPLEVALAEAFPEATLETMEEAAEVTLPVGVADGAAVTLAPAAAAAER